MGHCHISWESHKNNICNGFSRLQQTEEFVDMTLAADGHLVKVHKSLLALASPYIKEMIQSAPCPHPVLFLNQISHEVLSYILEYIYTGEVDVPLNMVTTFIEATKALHIVGARNLIPPHTKIIRKTNQHNKYGRNIAMKNMCNTAANLNVSENERFPNSDDTITETDDIDGRDFDRSNFEIQPVDNESDRMQIQTANTNLNNTNLQTIWNKNIQQANFGSEMCDNNSKTKKVLNSAFNKDDNLNNSDFETDGTDYHAICVRENSVLTRNNEQNIDSKSETPITNDIHSISNVCTSYLAPPEVLGNNVQNMITIDSYSQNNGRNGHTAETNTDIVINTNRVNETRSDDANIVNHSESNKEYSINVEIPTGNKQPPVITIKASALLNQNAVDVEMNAPAVLPNDITPVCAKTGDSTPLYLMTGRGSVQMILNRFMYYEHYDSKHGRRRRWRCIDYRKKRCPAYIDTDGEIIINRKFAHAHPFHDELIMKKGSARGVFTSIQEVMENNHNALMDES